MSCGLPAIVQHMLKHKVVIVNLVSPATGVFACLGEKRS